MARRRRRKSCAPSWLNRSPSGSSLTLSSSSKPSPAPLSANSKKSPSASNSPTGSGRHKRQFRLSAVRRINADVFRREVAGPVASHGFARVQIHDERNVFGEKFIAGGALVEIERLAAPQPGNARHFNVDARSVEGDAGTPGSREDTSPVRIAAGEGCFHQRRSGDRFRDAAGRGFRLRMAHFNFDDALGAFAIGNDLQRERTAHFFQSDSARTWRP